MFLQWIRCGSVEQLSAVFILIKSRILRIQNDVNSGDFVTGVNCDRVSLERKVKGRFVEVPEFRSSRHRHGRVKGAYARATHETGIHRLNFNRVGTGRYCDFVVANESRVSRAGLTSRDVILPR